MSTTILMYIFNNLQQKKCFDNLVFLKFNLSM